MNSTVVSGPYRLEGDYQPPGDKSISHRALMFGALSEGTSVYSHFLGAEDCLHTLGAFRSLGVSIEHDEKKQTVAVHGAGVRGLKGPASALYLGNSGTSIRLLLGILAGNRFEAVLTGDESLVCRPMRRVTHPLKQMGAQIKGADHGNFAPLTIRGGRLKGIDFVNELSSAQVKSAILLAGLYAEGKTRIREPIPSRDHTERFLEASGARFSREDGWVVVEQTDRLVPLNASIPGDFSAAAFFITGAAMTPGARLAVRHVGLNPTRTGLLEVLARMGACIRVEPTVQSPEPLGNVYVEGARLCGTRVAKPEVPSLIDEFPILMTAMALAEGESLISGAEELRVKETDRINSMVLNLNAVGGRLQELPDGCLIQGVEKLKPGRVRSFGDHRTAMSMALAAMAMDGELAIEGVDCVATSFPTFFNDLGKLRTGKSR